MSASLQISIGTTKLKVQTLILIMEKDDEIVRTYNKVLVWSLNLPSFVYFGWNQVIQFWVRLWFFIVSNGFLNDRNINHIILEWGEYLRLRFKAISIILMWLTLKKCRLNLLSFAYFGLNQAIQFWARLWFFIVLNTFLNDININCIILEQWEYIILRFKALSIILMWLTLKKYHCLNLPSFSYFGWNQAIQFWASVWFFTVSNVFLNA